MTTAVLALQGAFAEHARALGRLGEQTVELRQASDLDLPFDRLVLPGGESTVQTRLLEKLGMLEPLRERIVAGMPVLGTCAGLVLLATEIADAGGDGDVLAGRKLAARFATLPMRVQRNAYGRQLASFHVDARLESGGTLPATFIRAPRIVDVGDEVEVLARVDGAPVAVRHGNQIATAFHPELDDNPLVHDMLLQL